VLPADVRDESAVAALFAEVERRFGRLDLLFNNAGMFGPVARIDQVSPADWQAVVDVNLTGSFLCARAAFALMLRQQPQGGRIINNGSVSAHTPRPNSVAYSATKHAMTGLTKSIALEGRPFRIICRQVDIGNAATDMTAGAQVGMLQPEGSIAPEATMDVTHAAATVVHMASLPLEANVQFATVLASACRSRGAADPRDACRFGSGDEIAAASAVAAPPRHAHCRSGRLFAVRVGAGVTLILSADLAIRVVYVVFEVPESVVVNGVSRGRLLSDRDVFGVGCRGVGRERGRVGGVAADSRWRVRGCYAVRCRGVGAGTCRSRAAGPGLWFSAGAGVGRRGRRNSSLRSVWE